MLVRSTGLLGLFSFTPQGLQGKEPLRWAGWDVLRGGVAAAT